LKVLTNATVEKVLFDAFDPQGKLVAGGVMFRNQRQTRIVKARKEVILSAGAFGSPQILERSGIGSKTILDENKINIMYENENVGENLQDHVLALLGFEVADGQFTNEAFRNEEFFNDAVAQYVANRDGPLSVAPCSTAFLSYEQLLANAQKGKVPQGLEDVLTSSEEQPALAKQIELTRDKLFDPIEATAQHLFITGGFTPALASNASAFFGTTSPGSYLTLAGILEHPFSRGTVHIKSSEPSDYPIIDPKYLDAEVDLEVLADIMLNLQTIARTEPFASLLKDQGQVFQPGYTELTEENVREQIKITSGSQYHPIGTCAMSPRDKGGVVNERLIVHGTSNLRVVDASIFPLHVRANSKFIHRSS
jgi:choline dehydrogenase-like flavoprotein